MAGTHRTPPHLVELIEQLHEKPYAFDFFQAIRLLDCARPDLPQTGCSDSPRLDPFRIAQEASPTFAPASLTAFEPANDYHPPRLIQRFLGLFGPQGPLPMHLTDYAYARIHQNRPPDPTFSRFADLFHHRILSFFYRAWARVRPTVNFDDGSRDRFGEYVAAAFGMGMPSLTNRDAMPDLPKRHFSGYLGCQTKHAEGLLAILRGYFRLPVDLEQFVGQWIELPADCMCRIGSAPAVSSLGTSMTIGSHVWDCQQKFRVVLGPLSAESFYNFLPISLEKAPENTSLDGAIQQDAADAVYINAKFFTGNEESPWAQAVAVKNGKVLVAGDLLAVDRVTDPSTAVIDLGGAFVLPDLRLAPPSTGELDLDATSSTECQLLPKPSNQWSTLEAAFRQAQQAGSPAAGKLPREANRAALQSALLELIRESSATDSDRASPSLDPGAHADMLVVDQDVFQLVDDDQADRIRDTRVLRVIFDGEQAYDLTQHHKASALDDEAPLLRRRPTRTSANRTAEFNDDPTEESQEMDARTSSTNASVSESAEGSERAAADRVFVNGLVYTGNEGNPWAATVAVRSGKILAIGEPTDVDDLRSADTEVIDLDGALLLPDLDLSPTSAQDTDGSPNEAGLASPSECKRFPDPSNRWSTLESSFRRAQKQTSYEDKDQIEDSSADNDLAALKAAIRELIPKPPTAIQDASLAVNASALTEGSRADMIVVNQNLFQLVQRDEAACIRDTRVTRVIFDGELVYDLTQPIAPSPALLPTRRRIARPESSAADPGGSSRHDGSNADRSHQAQPATDDTDQSRVSLDRLIALVRTYVGDQLGWDAQLILQQDETPPLALGMHSHLGWSTWLLRDAIDRDPGDLILDAMEVVPSSLDSERLMFHPISNWDHRALGQRHDGSLIVDQPADGSG